MGTDERDVVTQMPLPEEFEEDLRAKIKAAIGKELDKWQDKMEALIDQKIQREVAHAMKAMEESTLTEILAESPDNAPAPKSTGVDYHPYFKQKPKKLFPSVITDPKDLTAEQIVVINDLLMKLKEAQKAHDTVKARIIRNELRFRGWYISKHGYDPIPIQENKPGAISEFKKMMDKKFPKT